MSHIVIENGYHKSSKSKDEKGVFLTGEYLTGEDKEDGYRAGVTLKAVF